MPTGIIAAISIGAICGLTILAMFCCYCVKKWKRRRVQPGAVHPHGHAHGAHPPQPSVILGHRDEPSYGTNSFQDLIMADKRRSSFPPLHDDLPPHWTAPPYFQNKQS